MTKDKIQKCKKNFCIFPSFLTIKKIQQLTELQHLYFIVNLMIFIVLMFLQSIIYSRQKV